MACFYMKFTEMMFLLLIYRWLLDIHVLNLFQLIFSFDFLVIRLKIDKWS